MKNKTILLSLSFLFLIQILSAQEAKLERSPLFPKEGDFGASI